MREIIFGALTAGIIFLGVNGFNIIPIVFFLALTGVFLYASGFKGKSFAFAAPKIKNNNLVLFEQIGGLESAKKELQEALDFVRDIAATSTLGIRPLKGLLLMGPPGTGKTLLAKAAAQYTDSVFLSAAGSDFVEMYVGVGAQRVRQLFSEARKLAKQQHKSSAVVFIDEIEVLAGKRGSNTSNMEYDQTLNALLVEMDGISGQDDVRVLVIGATNRVDIIDPAVLRPGRFDRQVRVDLPDKQGRLHILKLHMANKPMADDVDLDEIAKETFSFSGAHLENLANEAAIAAYRDNGTVVTHRHLKDAIDKVILGERLERKPSPEEMYRIAVHEVGHAIISEQNRPQSVAAITVTSRGQAMGYMRQNYQDDIYLYTEQHLRQQMAVFIAGAVSEEMMTGHRSTGAQNDLQQVAKLAKQLVFAGMSPAGIVSPEDMPQELLHTTLSKLVSEIEQSVQQTLLPYREMIGELAQHLVAHEVLSGNDFRAMLNRKAA